MFGQRRLKPFAWSVQKLRCPHEKMHPILPKMRSGKILIRLREYAGWSESLLGTNVFVWHCFYLLSFSYIDNTTKNTRNNDFLRCGWIDGRRLFAKYLWTGKWKCVPYNMCAQQRGRSASASARSHVNLHWPEKMINEKGEKIIIYGNHYLNRHYLVDRVSEFFNAAFFMASKPGLLSFLL